MQFYYRKNLTKYTDTDKIPQCRIPDAWFLAANLLGALTGNPAGFPTFFQMGQKPPPALAPLWQTAPCRLPRHPSSSMLKKGNCRVPNQHRSPRASESIPCLVSVPTTPKDLRHPWSSRGAGGHCASCLHSAPPLFIHLSRLPRALLSRDAGEFVALLLQCLPTVTWSRSCCSRHHLSHPFHWLIYVPLTSGVTLPNSLCSQKHLENIGSHPWEHQQPGSLV